MPKLCLQLLLAALPLAAGESGLSLAEALAAARAGNQASELAAARIQRSSAQRRLALAALLPSLSAAASAQRSGLSHHPFEHPPADRARLSAQVQVTLLDPGAWFGLAAARASAAAGELDAAELQRALAFEVAASFLTALSADRQVAAARHRQEVAERAVEEGAARVALGVATALDQTRSRLELASAEVAVGDARLAARTARLALAELIVQPADGPLAEPAPALLPEGGLEELVRIAGSQRADLRAAGLRTVADARSEGQQRSGWLPTVGASLSWDLSEATPQLAPAGEPGWTAALEARWTLFDGGARAAQVELAQAQRRESRAALLAAQRRLRTDLATAQERLASAALALRLAEAQVGLARENLEAVRARAAQGLATGLQVADAGASLYEAESGLVARRLDADSSRLRLRQLLGWGPLEEPCTVSALSRPFALG